MTLWQHELIFNLKHMICILDSINSRDKNIFYLYDILLMTTTVKKVSMAWFSRKEELNVLIDKIQRLIIYHVGSAK